VSDMRRVELWRDSTESAFGWDRAGCGTHMARPPASQTQQTSSRLLLVPLTLQIGMAR
jgi:hypothetical protein